MTLIYDIDHNLVPQPKTEKPIEATPNWWKESQGQKQKPKRTWDSIAWDSDWTEKGSDRKDKDSNWKEKDYAPEKLGHWSDWKEKNSAGFWIENAQGREGKTYATKSPNVHKRDGQIAVWAIPKKYDFL